MIDERKLIGELDAWWETLDPRMDSTIYDVIEAVKEKIDDAEKVGEWIPVTCAPDEESGELELTCQLPEAGERILVVDNQGYISIDEQCCDDDGWYLDDHADWLDVVAWMPLPEVYQVEGGER